MKRCITLLLVAALCIIPAFAHPHITDHPVTEPVCSAWAQDEVSKAMEWGLTPEYNILEDYRTPITRSQFGELAMQYIALQEGYDPGQLGAAAKYFWGEKDPDGQVIPPFKDSGWQDNYAYYLGLVDGRGDGTFDPTGPITRQEAAVMLGRAYEKCGGSLSETPETPVFSDEAAIADWARESAAALAGMGVMRGLDDGSFLPGGSYTVEQCMVTLYRLYEDAPVSRKNGNVKPLFTYEQCMESVKSGTDESVKSGGPGMYVETELRGPVATYVRINQGGVMHASGYLSFVYNDGGIKTIDLGICDFPSSSSILISASTMTENCRFSEDGKLFYCDVRYPDDTYRFDSDAPVHVAGLYHITIDVETCQFQLEREDL